MTAVVRNRGQLSPAPQLKIQVTDVYDSAALAAVVTGHDALISAFNPGWKDPNLYADQVRGTTSIFKALKSTASSEYYGLAVRAVLRLSPAFVSSMHRISQRRSNRVHSPPLRHLINCADRLLTGLTCLPPRI